MFSYALCNSVKVNTTRLTYISRCKFYFIINNMPIKRIPVVHKFGIISQTHQEEIKEKYLKSQTPNQRENTHIERDTDSSHLEALLYQLEKEENEIIREDFEEKLSVFVLKAKRQLNCVENKPTWEIYKKSLSELSLLLNCSVGTLSEAAFVIMNNSLSSAPLTRHLIDCLLDIGLRCLQGFISSDESKNCKRIQNIHFKMQICSLIFTRLYYHYIASDLNESCSRHKKAMNWYIVQHLLHLLEKKNNRYLKLILTGIKHTLCQYEESPFDWFSINLILSKIQVISSKVEMTHQERYGGKMFTTNFDETGDEVNGIQNIRTGDKTRINHNGNTKAVKFLSNSLQLWKSVSRSTKLSDDILVALKSTNLHEIYCEDCSWLNADLAFHVLKECAKLKLSHLQLVLHIASQCHYLPPRDRHHRLTHTQNLERLTTTKSPCSSVRTPRISHKVDGFLNDTCQAERNTDVDNIENGQHKIDEVTLTRLSLKDEDKHFEACKVPTSNFEHIQRVQAKEHNGKLWDWKLVLAYVFCLRDICLHGLSVDIQKVALLGDETHHGLIDFLTCYETEDSWKIRSGCYVALKGLQHAFMADDTKNGMKNIICNTLMQFESTEQNLKILRIIRNQSRSQFTEIKDGVLYSKMATNLCILILPADKNVKEHSKDNTSSGKKNLEKCRLPQPEVKKHDIPPFIFKNPDVSRYETNSWKEVQNVVALYYQKELEEDEMQRKNVFENTDFPNY